jgi:hypothetical protein
MTSTFNYAANCKSGAAKVVVEGTPKGGSFRFDADQKPALLRALGAVRAAVDPMSPLRAHLNSTMSPGFPAFADNVFILFTQEAGKYRSTQSPKYPEPYRSALVDTFCEPLNSCS